MSDDPQAPQGFSPARAARLLLAAAAMAFVFALPASLHLLLTIC